MSIKSGRCNVCGTDEPGQHIYYFNGMRYCEECAKRFEKEGKINDRIYVEELEEQADKLKRR